jgi:hypothetical protein
MRNLRPGTSIDRVPAAPAHRLAPREFHHIPPFHPLQRVIVDYTGGALFSPEPMPYMSGRSTKWTQDLRVQLLAEPRVTPSNRHALPPSTKFD